MTRTKINGQPVTAYTVPMALCEHRNEKKFWQGYESSGTVRHAGWLCPDCGRVRAVPRIVAHRVNYWLPALLFLGFAALLVAWWWLNS